MEYEPYTVDFDVFTIFQLLCVDIHLSCPRCLNTLLFKSRKSKVASRLICTRLCHSEAGDWAFLQERLCPRRDSPFASLLCHIWYPAMLIPVNFYCWNMLYGSFQVNSAWLPDGQPWAFFTIQDGRHDSIWHIAVSNFLSFCLISKFNASRNRF